MIDAYDPGTLINLHEVARLASFSLQRCIEEHVEERQLNLVTINIASDGLHPSFLK